MVFILWLNQFGITEYLPNVASSVLTHVDILTYLTFKTNIRDRVYYSPHFTDEKIEEQRDKVTFQGFTASSGTAGLVPHLYTLRLIKLALISKCY